MLQITIHILKQFLQDAKLIYDIQVIIKPNIVHPNFILNLSDET
jgi:hypothetical protein